MIDTLCNGWVALEDCGRVGSRVRVRDTTGDDVRSLSVYRSSLGGSVRGPSGIHVVKRTRRKVYGIGAGSLREAGS